VARVVRTLCVEGDVVEARVLGAPRAGLVSGYFNDFDRLAAAVARYDGRAEAIYFTLNPVRPDLLARGNNRLVGWAKHVTSDADVLRRRWMLIDLDPARPSGISSSEQELRAAIARREEIVEWLDLAGFPGGLRGMSGNGAHLLYRLDNLPNDEEHTALIQACIAVVAARFGDRTVDVDSKVYNASRLCKLYGTLVRKGENLPDRPHRRSCLDIPDAPLEPVSVEQLRWLAGQAAGPARTPSPRSASHATAGRRLDVPAYLAAAGLVEGSDYRVKPKNGVTWYNLRLCPVHVDPHPNYECGICQMDDGAMGAKCQHDSSKTWRDFKAALGDPTPFYIGNDASLPAGQAGSAPPQTNDLQMDGPLSPSAPGNGEIDLNEVLTFAYCPMKYQWQYRKGVSPPWTGEGIIRQVVWNGLADFYTDAACSPLEGIQQRWRDLLTAWEIPQIYDTLETYARTRTEIMLLFVTGQIRKPTGELYQAPRRTEAYRQLAEQKGLLSLRAGIDRSAAGIPAVLSDEDSLADVYADTVEIALRFRKPAPSDILGVQEPFSVSLPDGQTLLGRADLAAPGDDDGKAVLEIWDLAPTASPWPILRRDLRVAAALRAESARWPAGVERVRVRYLRTGETVDVFGRTIPPWTQSLLVIAGQAVRASAFGVPRLAVSALQCKGCQYWQECTSDAGWNILGECRNIPSFTAEHAESVEKT